MKVILLNQNPAVSRLVRLSIEKIGYKLEEYSNIAQLDEQNPADVFICDHELVDDSVDYTANLAVLSNLSDKTHIQLKYIKIILSNCTE